MTDTGVAGGSIEDALGIGTEADAARRPLLVHSQIVPQKLCEPLDALPWRREYKNVGSTKKGFRRNLERNDQHHRRPRSGRPQEIADARILGHVVVARSPPENQVAGARKVRL